MALTSGTKLGVYEIRAAIGAGGMGEVYRASDTKLGRAVAIKVLPEALASDPERIARFEREAKSLAALNHAHIAQIYGFEAIPNLESQLPNHVLVLEYVDGETLAERIARGPVKTAEAVRVAGQIAEALEAAHEKGIVHRDLKPANVKITSDEQVKVLDFGLAKALEPAGTGGPGGMTFSPTLSIMATQAGMILGTAAYMSPEQAKGLPADQRSDIFSFGVVLFEMLTGRQPFRGETAPEVLASVMIRDADLTSLPATIHPRLGDLIRRCLQKNPKQRWQHVGDVRAELESIAADPAGASAVRAGTVPARPLWRRALTAVVASTIVGAVAATAAWMLKPQPKPIVTRFSIALPEGQQFTNVGRQVVAVSPNGTAIVYVANARLMLRSNGDPDPHPIPGSDRFDAVLNPVFSPDGQSIAFYADNAIRRIAVAGGAAVTLGQATAPFGMSWTGDSILFGQGRAGVARVSATGGKTETIVKVGDAELAHGPVMLPDGDSVMFTLAKTATIGSDRWDHAQIVTQSLKTGRRKTLIEAGSDARYVPTGHLLYAVGGVLIAVRFDVSRVAVIGGPTPIVEGVRRSNGGSTGTTQFDVSADGMAAYLPGPVSLEVGQFNVVIVDRKGSVQPLKLPPGAYETPRLSPDAKRIALGTNDDREAVVWVYELSGASALRRLTTTGRNRFPVWSPDGQRIAFQSISDNDGGIFVQRADGIGTPERLTKTSDGEAHFPEAWSPDGKFLLYAITKQTYSTLWLFSFADRKTVPFGGVKTTRGYLPAASFSPDGRWVAYMSDDNATATARIDVQPFPATGTRYELGQGIHPAWTRDGTQILHNSAPGHYAAYAVTTQPTFTFAQPEALPRPFADTGPNVEREYDPLPDGNAIAIAGVTQWSAGSTLVPEIRVVLNWFEDLRQRAPVK